MRIGVSNRHAILSLPTRRLPAPARGRHFRQPPTGRAAGASGESQASCPEPTALRAPLGHRRDGRKDEGSSRRTGSPLTNLPLRNSSYSRLGSEVGAGSGLRMRRGLPAPPSAGWGRSLGLAGRAVGALQFSVYRFAFLTASRWSYLRSWKFAFTFVISLCTKLLVSVLSQS